MLFRRYARTSTEFHNVVSSTHPSVPNTHCFKYVARGHLLHFPKLLMVGARCGLEFGVRKLKILEPFLHLCALCLKFVACFVHALQGLFELLYSRLVPFPGDILDSARLLCICRRNLLLLCVLSIFFKLGLELLNLGQRLRLLELLVHQVEVLLGPLKLSNYLCYLLGDGACS